MNHITLIGRLTADPDTKPYGKEGNTYTRYTLAMDNGNDTDFIPCICWNKQSEFASKYLFKGMKIAIEGALKSNTYETKDKKKVTSYCVNVSRHEFVEPKRKENPQGEFMLIPDDIDDNELPFK